MKVNIYTILAASVMLLSLFLPWLSYSCSALNHPSLLNIFFMSYSPFRDTVNAIVYNSSSSQPLGYYGPESLSTKPLLDRSLFTTLNVYYTSVTVVALLFVFSAALMIATSLIGSDWGRVGRKLAIVSSNLAFLSIFAYLMVALWRVGGYGNSWRFIVDMTQSFAPYLDFGFWLALLGTIAAYASWLHPIFINLDTKIVPGKFDVFKRWLPVSEWEKTFVVAVFSFLPVWIFTIVYLFLI